MGQALARLDNSRAVPLIGGAYTARSLIANAQRCVNLFPEQNQGDAEEPVTHYPTPGLTLLAAAPVPGPARGAYWATNNQLFYVVSSSVYYIDDAYAFHLLGQLGTNAGIVYMVDDSTEILLVDGSNTGYKINLSTHAFSIITDPNFLGGVRCDFLDTFLLSNIPDTQEFQSTLPNTFAWDPLYFASKTGFSDQLITLAVMHREIYLLGELTSEIWFNAGNSGFPFEIIPGIFVQHGCVAPYSIAQHDIALFFLSMDKDGQGIALTIKDYKATRISTHAMEVAWSKYPTISDAVGWTYQQQGHIFWVVNFPSGDATWVYDLQTGEWHERVWSDPNDGTEHRHRGQVAALGYNNINVCGDWQNGSLYQLDPGNFTDNGSPIVRRRGFPHLVGNGDRTYYACFRADMEAGNTLPGGDNVVYLRWSDDRGRTFGNAVGRALAPGDYVAQPQWRRTGNARDRVFELFWSGAFATALQGAWIDAFKMAS